MQTLSAPMTFTRSLQASSLAVKVAAVVVGSLLIAAATQVEVPMFPVPMTMQTFAVLVVGMLYGPRLGALTVVAYLAYGVAGLPVFSGGANFAMLMAKPFTAGYLVGFVAMAAAAGWVVSRVSGLLGAVLAVIAGTAVLYVLGLAWLSVMLGGDVGKAVSVGAIPFLVGDLVKAALAIAVREGLGRVNIARRD